MISPAQMPAAQTEAPAVLGAALMLLAFAAAAAAGWYVLRRWWRREEKPAEAGWTLQQLREMKSRGQITEAEYERLKAAALRDAETGARPNA